jgi:hypothetical protein
MGTVSMLLLVTNSVVFRDHENNIIQIFKSINDWFKANLLTLNFDKTYFIQFFTKNSSPVDNYIDYGNNLDC